MHISPGLPGSRLRGKHHWHDRLSFSQSRRRLARLFRYVLCLRHILRGSDRDCRSHLFTYTNADSPLRSRRSQHRPLGIGVVLVLKILHGCGWHRRWSTLGNGDRRGVERVSVVSSRARNWATGRWEPNVSPSGVHVRRLLHGLRWRRERFPLERPTVVVAHTPRTTSRGQLI